MKNDIERRCLNEIRMTDEGEGRTIVGYASVFNTPTDIGGMFREQIAPGAFADAIGRDDVRALIDHDPSKVLGRNTAGTLRMSEDKKGLRVEIDMPDTQQARDLQVSMARGDIDQMSFGFQALRQEWDRTDDVPLRTIQEATLFDVSVVTFPAYPEAKAGLRSLQAIQSKSVSHRTLARVTMRQRQLESLAR